MESVSLYEKLVATIDEIMSGTQPAYSISIAITKTWFTSGTPLERELLTQFEQNLSNYIEEDIHDAYRSTRHADIRPDKTEFYRGRILQIKKYHAAHDSYLRSIELVIKRLRAEREARSSDSGSGSGSVISVR